MFPYIPNVYMKFYIVLVHLIIFSNVKKKQLLANRLPIAGLSLAHLSIPHVLNNCLPIACQPLAHNR